MGSSLINNFIRKIPPYQLTMIVLMAILYLTLFPQPLGEEEIFLFEGADKVVHFIMFGGLTGTYIFDRYRIDKTLTLRGALLCAIISTLLGIIIEFLQGLTGRSSDLYDGIADTLGAFTAVPICVWLHWVNVIVNRRS